MIHESKLPFVSRIEFIRSKLAFFSAHVTKYMTWIAVPTETMEKYYV